MSLVAFARKCPVCTALTSFACGGAAALLGVWLLGTPWKNERVVEVEKVVEKPVERIVEKVVEKVVEKPGAKEAKPRRSDLVVAQKGQSFNLGSDLSEYFVNETRKLPGVEQVSEAIVDLVDVIRENGTSNAILVQGWNPDNVGYEDMKLLAGRKLQPADRHKVMIGNTLAEEMGKKVGDKIAFGADRGSSYEVVGVFKSASFYENSGVIVPLADGQQMSGRKGRVTGFEVRVKKSSPDSAAAVDAVRHKIEALRDPKDPTVRLRADAPERP